MKGSPLAPKPFETSANANQLEAIRSTAGPLLIIAPPGSGKTFTLVERITYLITAQSVEPESLLVVTFTTKAARELTSRISDRLNAMHISFNPNEAYIGTFHCICLRILDQYRELTRLERSYTLLDDFDQRFFLYRHLFDYLKIPGSILVMGKCAPWRQAGELQRRFNKLTEEAVDLDILSQAPEPEVRVLAACYRLYRRQLEEANSLDFAGLQLEALTLLQEYPHVRRELHGRISHILFDEFQDSNSIQLRILHLLTNERQNICVVGDDDQAIYRFRGASIRNILEFPALFPKGACKLVTLSVNYRSHPEIIRFYSQWMHRQKWVEGNRRFRFTKTIQPKEHDFPPLPAVIKIEAPEGNKFRRDVLGFLLRLKESGQLTDWNQIAFIFPSVRHPSVVALAQHLEEQGIPVYSPRSGMFFDREEIRLIIGGLLFIVPSFQHVRKWADDARLEIWDYYDESCSKPFAEELRKPENATLLEWASERAWHHLGLTDNTDYAFTGLFYQLLAFPLFRRYLSEHAEDGGRAARNLGTFSGLLAKFEYLHHVKVLNPTWLTKNLRDLFNNFFRFLMDDGIDEHEDEREIAPSGCVSFMTVHQSKGLEFPVVVVGALGVTPRKGHDELDELIESQYLSRPPFEPLGQTKDFDFRRLYYTAFSRAQNLLVLACEGTPSKYFDDLLLHLPHWQQPAFQPELITLEAMRPNNLKREYSFTSDLAVYENCPVQYRFFKELGFMPVKASPMLFGTLVHETLEDIHKAALRGYGHGITPAQIEAWFDRNYDLLSRKERVYLAPLAKRAALNQVLRYYQREKDQFDRLREAEVEVSLVRGDYIFKGSIDLVRADGDAVEIIDFKADVIPDSEQDGESLQRHQRQLALYAHLVEERTGRRVSRMHLYYTGEAGNPYVSFTKDDKAINGTIATFDAIVRRIEEMDFGQESRPLRLCSACDLRLHCDSRH